MTSLHFTVLASSTIKRKKPWSRVEWIGTNKESVCLISKKRLSLLYLPSGRTKRVVDELKSYMKDVVSFSSSSSGQYVVALLSSGNLIRWNKDMRVVVQIEACPGFTASGVQAVDVSKCRIFISDNGQHIVILFDNCKLYVWDQTNFSSELCFGEWSFVALNHSMLSVLDFKAACVDAVFFKDQNFNSCCNCTLVGRIGGSLLVYCIALFWKENLQYLMPESANFNCALSFSSVVIDKTCGQAAKTWKLARCKISRNGQELAIGINYYKPHYASVAFLNLHANPYLSLDSQRLFSNVKGELSKFSGQSCWIADMSWTNDSLFLACITKYGSMFLLNKFGTSIKIATYAPDVETKESFMLQLHPFGDPKRNTQAQRTQLDPSQSIASSASSHRDGKHRFSISAHPRLPVVLCCDGYNVVVLQMVDVVRAYDVAFVSLVDVNQQLNATIQRYGLEAGLAKSGKYKPTALMKDQIKLREHKLVIMLSNFKAKFKKKENSKIKMKQKYKSEENLQTDENVLKLAKKLKEDEREVTSDTEIGNDLYESEGTRNFISRNVDKLNTSDFALTTEHFIMMEKLDGESLFNIIKRCASKLIGAWGLLASDRSLESRAPGSKALKSEVFLYFFQTLQSFCDVLIQCQKMQHCLPWRLDDVKPKSKVISVSHQQRNFGNILKKLASDLQSLVVWGGYKPQYVLVAMQVVVSSVMKLSSHAAEGCTSLRDVAENTSTAFTILHHSEIQFQKIKSYNFLNYIASVNSDEDSTSGVMDSEFAEGLSSPASKNLKLLPIWKELYEHLSSLFASETFHVLIPGVMKVIGYLQHLNMDLNAIGGMELYNTEDPAIVAMVSHISDYNFSDALNLAASILTEHFTQKREWRDQHYYAVELLYSTMLSYFADNISTISFVKLKNRQCTVERSLITLGIRNQNLSHVWNADHTLSLMLSCGQMYEASHLANQLGAWRVALAICAVAEKTHPFVKQIHNREHVWGKKKTTGFDILKARFKDLMPQFLADTKAGLVSENHNAAVEVLPFDKLCDFNPEMLLSSFSDLLTASVMSGYDMTTWICSHMVGLIKDLCRNLRLLIDQDVYLPAPPLYLPQPAPDFEKGHSPSISVRLRLSALLRTFIVFLQSAGMMEALGSWLVKYLQEVNQSSSPVDNKLAEKLSPDCKEIFECFQTVCEILWMLHIQEQLNILLRKYQDLREQNAFSKINDVIKECLKLAFRLTAFDKVLNCEADLQDLVICLCNDLKKDTHLADILAKFFYDLDKVNPKVLPRLDSLLGKMRHILVPVTDSENQSDDASPNDSKSSSNMQPLTVYYQQCCRIRKRQKIPHDLVVQTKAKIVKDQRYHKFLSQLFDVILGKTSNMLLQQSSSSKSSFTHSAGALVLSNRSKVAVAQLEISSQHVQNHSIFGNNSVDCQDVDNGRVFNNQDTLSLASNAAPLMDEAKLASVDSPQESKNHYFSVDMDKATSQEQSKYKLHTLKWPLLGISDAPKEMRKRLKRLLPYFTWLQHWVQRQVKAQKEILKPSICLHVTKQQLLHSLLVAEVRFGKHSFDAHNIGPPEERLERLQKDKDISSIADQVLPKTLLPSSSNEANETETVVSEIESLSESLTPTTSEDMSLSSQEKELSGNLAPADLGHKQLDSGLESGSHELIAKREVNLEENVPERRESSPESEVDAVVAEQPSDQTVDQRTVEKKDKESTSDIVPVEQAPVKESGSPPNASTQVELDRADNTQSQTTGDRITQAVQSEIQNVLLAQQVSLLSQILLGQTLNGSAQAVSAAQLQLQPIPGSQTLLNVDHTQIDQPQHSEVSPEQNAMQQDSIRVSVEQKTLQIPLQRNEDAKKFHIPLFHVDGIGKSEESKFVERTSPLFARKKQLSPRKDIHCPIKLLSCTGAGTRSETSHPKQTNRRLTFAKPEDDLSFTEPQINFVKVKQEQIARGQRNSQLILPPTKPSAPIHSHIHPQEQRVDFPLLNKTPQRPHEGAKSNFSKPSGNYYKSPKVARSEVPSGGFVTLKAPEVPVVTRLEQGIIPRLINPAEVLQHHTRKMNFQTAKTAVRRLDTVRRPPVSMLKLSEPSLEIEAHRKPVLVQPRTTEELSVPRPTQPIRNEVVTTQIPSGIKDETPVVKNEPPVTTESDKSPKTNMTDDVVEYSLMSDLKPAADIHYNAALMKRVPVKPRMKDVELQVEVEVVNKDDYDDRDGVERTKLSQPNPSVKLFNRYQEIFSGQERVPGMEFLHMGEVKTENVVSGISNEPEPIGSPPNPENIDPGFPTTNNEVSQTGPSHDVTDILSTHVKAAVKVNQVRGETRNRWMSAMSQMNAQLDAINSMAQRIDEDFKLSKKLVNFIDKLDDDTNVPTTHKRFIEKPTPATEDDVLLTADVYHSSSEEFTSIVLSPKHETRLSVLDRQEESTFIAPKYESMFVVESVKNFPKDCQEWTNPYRNRLTEAQNLVLSAEGAPAVHFSLDVDSGSYSNDLMMEDLAGSRLEKENRENISEHGTSSEYSIKTDEDVREKMVVWSQRNKENEKFHDDFNTKKFQKSGKMTQNKKSLRRGKLYTPPNSRFLKMQKQREQERRERLANNMSRRLNASMKLLNEIQHDDAAIVQKQTSQKFKEQSGRGDRSLKERNYTSKAPGNFGDWSNIKGRKKNLQAKPQQTLRSSYTSDLDSTNLSDASILSAWEPSEEVRRILYGSVNRSKKNRSGKVTFDLRNENKQPDQTSSDRESHDTRSLLSSVDWNDIDAMTASVKLDQ
ncbi:unnamed protein product [Clavelina lepadiformis]|uniref:Uncharacterized protein n=1 Tax=Clavelina lepadiformis TaxID=159417 RepID=A0ABP0G550_CLALP